MTSRSSFFNLLKEDLRRRLWTLILSSLVFFGTFIVAFTMAIQSDASRYRGLDYTKTQFIERMSERICRDFCNTWPWFALVAVVGALICGMSGFAYLHSKKQMDFYHSLPVKREKIFAVRLINGILIYAVPYFIGMLYVYLLCACYGVMTVNILSCSMFYFLVHLMGYTIMYLATILAMMLTGKLLIAFFGICVINLYVPAVYGLFMTLKETFFVTNYSSSYDLEKALLFSRWLSPASYYYKVISTAIDDTQMFWKEALLFPLFAAVLVVLNLWLYKKRASEKADISMAFKVTEPVVRMMISVPVGVLASMLFGTIQQGMGTNSYIFWLVFGGFFGGFLCHGIIEALYTGDVKKCLSHKLQLLAAMLFAAAIPLIFLFDIFKYDSYLPKKSEIKSMAVSCSNMRFGGSYYDENGWISATEYALENMEITDIDVIFELAEKLSEDAGKNRVERFTDGYGYWYTEDYAYYGMQEKVNNVDFILRYNLKNGSRVTRRYRYNYYEVKHLMELIYNNPEYKSAVHPVFALLKAGHAINSVEVYSPANGRYATIEKKCDVLVETYANELLSLNYEDLRNSNPIGALNVQFTVGEEEGYEYFETIEIQVYPEMEQTIALLREQGYYMSSIKEAADIKKITISYCGSANELKHLLGMEVDYSEKPDLYKEVELVITKPSELAEIQKRLVYRYYEASFVDTIVYKGFLDVTVYFGSEDIYGRNERFYFDDGKIPQFVIDNLFEMLNATANY